MKIFDSHVHIFNPGIIKNVVQRSGLIQALSLNIGNIGDRLSPSSLRAGMREASVAGALMLPTSDVNRLAEVNRSFVQTASGFPGLLHTAGTLHPDFKDIESELSYLNSNSVYVIKLCSFSQKFSLTDPKTFAMFDRIEAFNKTAGVPFSAVLDTLTLADRYFGTDPANTTTPRTLMDLVRRFPGIRFIGAHMGGLGAPFEELSRWLEPAPNFYLDTSNAMHTLTKDQFLQMLHRHGPGHIIFGTDWPWFTHRSEIERLESYMESAGFTMADKRAVFSGNILKILGISRSDAVSPLHG